VIRRATPRDADRVAAWEAACFPGEAWTRAQVLGELGRAGGIALLDEAGGYVLGWALAGEAELLRIAVHPDGRRHGLGGRLMGAFQDAARAAGAEALFLEVRADNAPARALYAAQGWSGAGVRRRYYRDGTDAVVLTRPA
jgi:ribosomal-protein-alanine N-acetyltransferase